MPRTTQEYCAEIRKTHFCEDYDLSDADVDRIAQLLKQYKDDVAADPVPRIREYAERAERDLKNLQEATKKMESALKNALQNPYTGYLIFDMALAPRKGGETPEEWQCSANRAELFLESLSEFTAIVGTIAPDDLSQQENIPRYGRGRPSAIERDWLVSALYNAVESIASANLQLPGHLEGMPTKSDVYESIAELLPIVDLKVDVHRLRSIRPVSR